MRMTCRLLCGAILPLVALAALVATDALATETRVHSMGEIGLYTRDNSNIFLFPGTLMQYSKQAVGEFRVKENDDSYTIGGNLNLGQDAVLGVYLNRPVEVDIPAEVAQEFPDVSLSSATDLLYGRRMASFDLGVRLSLAMDSYSRDVLVGVDDVEELKQSAHNIGLAAGISNKTLDLGVRFDLPGLKWEYQKAETKWSGTGLQFVARGFFGNDPKRLEFVPAAALGIGSGTYEEDSGIQGEENFKVDYSRFMLQLGGGVNYYLNEANLLVFGVDLIGINKWKSDVKDGTETTSSYTTMPAFRMGIESKIKPWLKGRLGAVQSYATYSYKTKPDGGTETETSQRITAFDTYFGLGATTGKFAFDAAINEGLLFDGPNFITGGVDPLAYKLSVTYMP